MGKTAHTPGPWATEYRTINDDGGKAQVIYPVADSDNFIATAHWHSVKIPGGFTTNREANARLIAAAPDLLEALEWYKNQMCEGFCEDLKAEDYYSESMDFHCAGCKARAAISRAKGEA